MAIDEQTHVALPKLYGAPAYARKVPTVAHRPRPFDPDDLPITAQQTDDERELVETLPAHAYAPGGGYILEGSHDQAGQRGGNLTLQPRPFRLKTLAGKFLRNS